MPGEMVKFNLQTFLSEMRREQKDDHDALAREVREGFTTLKAEQDGYARRLQTVEATHASIVWFRRTVTGGTVLAAIDLIFNHVPTWVRHLLGH